MKKLMFLVLLSSAALCNETEIASEVLNRADEEKLLNEMVADELKELGIDCPFSFRGTFNFTALSMHQKLKDGGDNPVSALESDVFLKYCDKHDQCNFGVEIGAKVNSGVMKQGSPILRVAYVFVGSEAIGTMKVGFTSTVADSMATNGGSVLVGYGGAASRNLSIFYNESAGSFVDMGFPFDDNKAAKIALTSAKFSGFSAGISFTPDSRSANPFKTLHPKPHNPEISEEKANFTGMRTAYSKNIVTGGVAYEFGDPQEFNGALSLCGWVGKGKTSVIGVDVENIGAYSVGAIVGYKDFKLAFGYCDNRKSLRSKKYATAGMESFDEDREYTFADPEVGLKPGADTGKMYSVGVSYAVNSKFTVSSGYFKSVVKFSDNEKSTADVLTAAGEYALHKSASVYAEYDMIRSDACARAQAYHKACDLSTAGKNRANAFMVGVKVNI
ncbi:MAG: porin [Holosporaceae bacterium]|jgi:predicted porin|nr:porin [Holosporaceae bacterium]